jgi:hypothetical protein
MLALALQAVASFNLVCTGTEFAALGDRTTERPLSVNYRIDLEAGRYCTGDCSETSALVRVTPQELVMVSETLPGTSRPSEISVSRESGQLTWHIVSGDLSYEGFAHCERGPFTGFPRPRF